MKDFWNKRYQQDHYVYGTGPNQFFKDFIDEHKPGNILLPADGEGRNGVYAAEKGWNVDAFDFSESARAKALELAKDRNVTLNYTIANFDNADLKSDEYDVIALIYAHLPSQKRRDIHHKLIHSLKKDGFIVLEAFSKKQLSYNSGGPKSEEMLYDLEDIKEDFKDLAIISIRQETTELDEGPYHKGEGNVIRLIAQKIK